VYFQAGEPKKAVAHYEQAIATTRIEGAIRDCQKKLAEARAAAAKEQ
jgi:hypothetical protein